MTRGLRAPLAGAFLLVGLLGACTASGSPDGYPRSVANVNITQADQRPVRAHSLPGILVDPKDPTRVFLAQVELRSRTCRLHVSHDGGNTFRTARADPVPPSFQFCAINAGGAEAPLAWANDGALLLAMHVQGANDPRFNTGNASLVVSRTYDEGQTWQTTIVADNRGKDPTEAAIRPHIVSDPNGRVYVSYARSYTPAGQTGRVSRPYVSVSTDGGKTFGAGSDMTGQRFASKPLYGGGAASLALASDGTLFGLFREEGRGAAATDLSLLLTRSADGGKSFEVFNVMQRTAFTDGWPELAVADLRGGGYALIGVFEDIALGDAAKQQVRDVFAVRSTDRGATWSDRQRLTDDPPADLFNKFNPGIAVAPNGRVDAAWFDFRNDNGNLLSDVYAASSTDGGATWSRNIRVSDHSSDRRIGPFANYGDVRGPVGVASSDYAGYFAWDDTRNGNVTTQSQDVYFSAIQQRPFPAPLGTTIIAFAVAAALGLVIAATILLGASIVVRRRRTAIASAPAG